MPKKGYKQTPEHRAKSAAARKGYKQTPEHTAVNWEKRGRNKSDRITVEVTCPDCGHLRFVQRDNVRSALKRDNFTGRCCSCNGKANGAAKKGKKQTPDHIAKRVAAMAGLNCSDETRAKIAAANIGPKNPRWLGGLSYLPYTWTFNDELREEVRRRDNYVCQLCGTPQSECNRALAVHHIDYDKKNSDPVNLITLCTSCHPKTNKNRKHWTTFFQAKMIKHAIDNL